MTCHKCHVANLAHNIPYPQFTRKGYQPHTHAFTLLTRLDEVKPYLVFFFLPQFEDIACGSTSGVWWRICTRRIGPMECQSGCPAGQLNDFDHLPCMPARPACVQDQCSSCLPRLTTLPRFQRLPHLSLLPRWMCLHSITGKRGNWSD